MNPPKGENPYAAPLAEIEGIPCPRCGKQMEAGRLKSATNIFWMKDTAGFRRRWIYGGSRLGNILSAFFGSKLPARHCPPCRLFELE